MQQGALGGGQGGGAAVGPPHRRGVQVHPAAAQLQGGLHALLQLGPVGAAQDQLDAQQKLLGQKRLGQVIVRPKAQAEQPVAVLVPRREEQRRDVRFGVQLPEQGKAVAVGQVDVQHHKIGLPARKGGTGFGAGLGGGQAAVACAGQCLAQKFQQLPVIVHQKYFGVLDLPQGGFPLRARPAVWQGAPFPLVWANSRPRAPLLSRPGVLPALLYRGPPPRATGPGKN